MDKIKKNIIKKININTNIAQEEGYKKVDINQPFSILNLPSKGAFYDTKFVLLKYLTAIEEQVLSDELLVESGLGIKMVIENLFVNSSINIDNMLLGDFQAILIYLRSTAYGDSVEVELTCPFCKKKEKNFFKLSNLDFKRPEVQPHNGKYVLEIKEKNLEIVIIPNTFKMLMDYIKELKNAYEVYYVAGEKFVVKKTKSLLLSYNIESINGITDKNEIKAIIKKLPKRYIDKILDFIKRNETGVDNNIKFTCPYCGEEFTQHIDIGHDFISLPYKYKDVILEEIFLITYYGKGITRADALAMPVYERKWHIRRIQEELEKKREAEEKAYNKARK